MKINRSLLVALFGAVFFTSAVAQTEAEVASLLTKAQRGNSIAQYNLGRAYASGKGVAADPIEAYVWLSLAYEGGFRAKALGNVAGSMDPAQLETARQRLVERRASLLSKPAAAAKNDPADSEANMPVVRTGPSSAPATTVPVAAAPSVALTQELATAVADKQQLSNELSKSWSETEDLKKQLAETQTTADFLTAETSKLHAERDTLTTKLNEQDRTLAGLRTERDHARTLGEQAESALAQANEKKAALESTLRAANESAATDKKWLGDELTKSFQEVTALKAQLAESAKTAAKAAAPGYPDLTGKVKELEASQTTLVADVTAAKQEAARLSSERLEREKLVATLQQQATELAAALSALQQETATLRRTAATPAAPAYPDLRDKAAGLEQQLVALTDAASQTSQQIATLTQAKAAAEKSLAEKPTAPPYPDLSGKVRELEATLAAQTETAEKSRAALQAQLAESAKAVAQPAAPAYPDLSGKVQELEAALAARTAEAGSAGQAAEALRQAQSAAEQKFAAAEQARTELAQQFDEFKRSALVNQRENVNRQSQIQMLESDKAALRQQSAADQTRLAELSSQLAASRRKVEEVYPTAPSYPDQRARVEQLETELAKTNEQANSMVSLLNRSQQEAKSAAEQAEQLRATIRELEGKVAAGRHSAPAMATAPAYPDLREQVSNLEIQLEAARALPKFVVTEEEFKTLKQELADTQEKLTTTLRGYALIEKERDTLAAQPAAPSGSPDQNRRISELEAQLATQSAELAQARQTGGASAAPVAAASGSGSDNPEHQQQIAALEDKLATALKGYSVLQAERDELAAKAGRVENSQSEVARLTEAYAALQRSTAQNERDLVATRALLQQVQGANTSLAQQNYQLKGSLAPEPVASRPAPKAAVNAPAAASRPVVIAAAAVPATAGRTHLVVAGDALAKLSQRYYGTTNRWQEIYNANRELIGSNGALRVGTELRIP